MTDVLVSDLKVGDQVAERDSYLLTVVEIMPVAGNRRGLDTRVTFKADGPCGTIQTFMSGTSRVRLVLRDGVAS